MVVGLIAGDEAVAEVSEGQDVEVALVQTPFYAEGGGQVGDFGEISGGGRDGFIVNDTQEVMPGLIMHFRQGGSRHGEYGPDGRCVR